jgi:hypothetical protein
MRATAVTLCVVLATALQGCAAPTMYRWGSYDETLYKHYKNPQDREAFVVGLKEVVLDAEKAGVKTPPGCYAEYGYALLEAGNAAEAATYFTKERDTWPESRLLMERMIAVTQTRAAPAGDKAPAATQGTAATLEGK